MAYQMCFTTCSSVMHIHISPAAPGRTSADPASPHRPSRTAGPAWPSRGGKTDGVVVVVFFILGNPVT